MSDTQHSVSNADVEKLLTDELGLAEVYVSSEGNHFNIIAVGECFADLSRVKKQQVVYAPLKELIAANTIHAVTIKSFTPEQWVREKQFNLPS